MCVHARAQTAQIKFTRIIERQNFAAIINAFAEVIDDFAQLIEMFTIWFAPASALHTIHASHVIRAFTVRILEPSLIFIGIGIPGFGTQLAEVGGIVITANIA